MVILGAIIGREGAVNDRILRAVATAEVLLAVSDEGYRELIRVMGYDDVKAKVTDPARAVAIALDIGISGTLYQPRHYDWPTVRDPKDGWLLDLAYESGAEHIVTDDPHLIDQQLALEKLGFSVISPPQLLSLLSVSS